MLWNKWGRNKWKSPKVQKIEKEEETRTEELYGFKGLPEVLKGEYAENYLFT